MIHIFYLHKEKKVLDLFLRSFKSIFFSVSRMIKNSTYFFIVFHKELIKILCSTTNRIKLLVVKTFFGKKTLINMLIN